ncbi:MAG: cytochrome c biogenesis heme-transporting ATPase CcmA [Gammaproteobacteria bacterium]|nr:cytochrome c biogenesis heme-transporting ATPase CcmA [Gammaproteobacteria bacterium]
MLSAFHLTSHRDLRLLFKDLSLEISPTEVLQVQGKNGSGKSTLLRILCGLREPDEGGVYWQDQAIQKCRAQYFKELTYIGHSNAIRYGLSPIENLTLFAKLEGRANPPAECEEALDYFGLKPFKNTLCKDLSLGQRRKVALARLVYAKTSLWILDEPFSGCDAFSREQLQKQIQKHTEDQGMVILSTHHSVDLPAKTLCLS